MSSIPNEAGNVRFDLPETSDLQFYAVVTPLIICVEVVVFGFAGWIAETFF